VPLLEELRLMDVQRAKQLLSDPYLLSKFRSEIAERHSRRNSFTRALADVSRALRELGVRHVVQARCAEHSAAHRNLLGRARLGTPPHMAAFCQYVVCNGYRSPFPTAGARGGWAGARWVVQPPRHALPCRQQLVHSGIAW
jgi:hypothetical protein